MSAARHIKGRFGLRLAATLVLTTSVVGTTQYVLAGRALTDRVLEHDLAGHRADAQVLASLYLAGADEPLAEIESLLGHMASRPGLTSAVLLDPQGEIALRGSKHSPEMAMQMPADEPMPGMEMPAEGAMPEMAMPADQDVPEMAMEAEPVPAADLAIAEEVRSSGDAHAERLAAADRVVHAVPVELGADRYVLLVARSDGPLQTQVRSVGNVLLLTLALGTALALPLFFLVGGRTLAATHRRAVDASIKDGLTGLGNHRYFHEQLAVTVADNAQSRAPLCLALVDLDDFKQVNDTEGHRRGDEVLASVARVLLSASPSDAYRVGGDEFALVLSGTLAEAEATAERVRQQVAALNLGVTTSIGVAPLVPGSTPQPLWDAADAALYAAKHGGRNRVVVDGSASAFAGV
jgi:diguanylate cyclase (GGDEF)-like protein